MFPSLIYVGVQAVASSAHQRVEASLHHVHVRSRCAWHPLCRRDPGRRAHIPAPPLGFGKWRHIHSLV